MSPPWMILVPKFGCREIERIAGIQVRLALARTEGCGEDRREPVKEGHTMRASGSPKHRLVIVWAALVVASLLVSCGCERLNTQARYNVISVKAAIQALLVAEDSYHLDHGTFATSLQELGSGVQEEPGSAVKYGYRFTLSGSPAHFSISAVPTAYGSTGYYTFYADESGVIRENHGPEPATADSPDIVKR